MVVTNRNSCLKLVETSFQTCFEPCVAHKNCVCHLSITGLFLQKSAVEEYLSTTDLSTEAGVRTKQVLLCMVRSLPPPAPHPNL